MNGSWYSRQTGSKWYVRIGNRVQQIDGDLGIVRKVEVVEQLQFMYNLTVDQAHTFFVGQSQWLVHQPASLSPLPFERCW